MLGGARQDSGGIIELDKEEGGEEMTLRFNAKQLLELIESIETGGGDATVLRSELETLEPEVRRAPTMRRGSRFREEEETAIDRINREVGDLFDGGVTDEIFSKLCELDFNHNMKELRRMCIEAGLSPNGHKKMLAAKLLAHWGRESQKNT